MALLFVESFDWMDTAMSGAQVDTALSRKTNSLDVLAFTDASTVAGIGGNGTALEFRETTHFVRFPLSKTTQAIDEVGCGVWVRGSGAGSFIGPATLMGLVDSNGTVFHMNVNIENDQFLSVHRGSTLIRRVPYILEMNQWYWVEFNQVINDSTGSWELKVDGVSIDSQTGADTRNGGNGVVNAIQIGGINNGLEATHIAGAIAWDDNGGTLTDFPGKLAFLTIHPDADGDDEQWSTSSGTDSFALVNETAPHDDDTDYIQDSTTGNRTLFTYDNISTNYTSVKGLQINMVVRESDASDFTVLNTFKQGGTVYGESSQAIAGQTFESLFNVRDTDPDTSVAWTDTGVNSLQAGVEVG